MAKDTVRTIRENETTQGVYHYIVPWGGSGYNQDRFALPPTPPGYYSPVRDDILRSTVYRESMWDTAVTIAIAKMVSQSWEVDGEAPLKVKRMQELLLGTNWVSFVSRQLRDFILTDNGQFIGIEHQTGAPGSRIIGLYHLDSRRATRTGDEDIPVIYRDRKDVYHELRSHQVITLVDNPDPSDMWNGVGHCAASRAYHKVYKLAAIETYVAEKVSGRRPLAIYFVNGITNKQLKDAIASAEEQAAQKGQTVYMGAVIAALAGDTPPQLVTIPLAEIPSGFDAATERKDAQLTYANALGLDPQDINPDLLASRAMGTGAQSQVIDDKAHGKTLSVWRQAMTHALNEYVLPDAVAFYFMENDLRDQRQKADVQASRAGTLSAYVQMGAIDGSQALQVAVDNDDLPREFIEIDETTGDTLSDTDKPDSESEVEDESLVPEIPELPEVDMNSEKAIEYHLARAAQITQQASRANAQRDSTVRETLQLMREAVKAMATREKETSGPPPAPQITVIVPESPAPVVNMPPAQITVHVPQSPPVVVNVAAPVVNVAPVIRMPAVTTKVDVLRDGRTGLISGTVERTTSETE